MRKIKISVGKWETYITADQLLAVLHAAGNGVSDLYVDDMTGAESFPGGKLEQNRYEKASAALDEAYRQAVSE